MLFDLYTLESRTHLLCIVKLLWNVFFHYAMSNDSNKQLRNTTFDCFRCDFWNEVCVLLFHFKKK